MTKRLEKFKNYMKHRLIYLSEDESILNSKNDIEKDKCFINTTNKSNIKLFTEKNKLSIDDYIDYGATSKIFKIKYSIKKNRNYKNFYFAMKVMSLNKIEIEIMKKSTINVISNNTPHFVILYSNYLCNENDNTIFDDINFIDNSIESDTSRKDLLINQLKGINSFLTDKKYSLLIMELFDGNLVSLLFNDLQRLSDETKKWIHSQIYISILSFHKLIDTYIHNDVQYKNFFYKKIECSDNEYFYYKIFNIDIYIKNIGYLIILGDYGLSEKNFDNEKSVLEDYRYISYNYEINSKIEEYISSKKRKIEGNIEENFFKEIFIENKLKLFLQQEDLPSNYKLLNEKVYIIN